MLDSYISKNFNYYPQLAVVLGDKTHKLYLYPLTDSKVIVTSKQIDLSKIDKIKSLCSIEFTNGLLKIETNECFFKDTSYNIEMVISRAIRQSLSVIAPLLGNQIDSEIVILVLLAFYGSKQQKDDKKITNISYLELPETLPAEIKEILTDAQIKNSELLSLLAN